MKANLMDFLKKYSPAEAGGSSGAGAGENSGINRRLKPRYSVHIKVEMLTKGLNHYAVEKCANVSLGGLFVCSDYSAEQDEKIHIRVIMSDKDSYFDIKTRVAWICDGHGSHPRGLGLEFVELTQEQNHIIARFLKDYVNVQSD
jgi:Tfp pilus assembly protein PilZ